MARSWACTWTRSDTVLMTTSSACQTGLAVRLSSSRQPRTSWTPTSPGLSPASLCPWRHVGRSSSDAYGPPCRTFRMGRPSPTASWPHVSVRPVPLVRWAWRTGRTRSASSSRVTASSAHMATSPATAAASTGRGSCSTSSGRSVAARSSDGSAPALPVAVGRPRDLDHSVAVGLPAPQCAHVVKDPGAIRVDRHVRPGRRVQHEVLDALSHLVGEEPGLEGLELRSHRRSLLVPRVVLVVLDDVGQLTRPLDVLGAVVPSQ